MNCFPKPPDDDSDDECNDRRAEVKEIKPIEMIRTEPGIAPIISRPASLSPAELKILKLQEENRKLRAELDNSHEEVLRWRTMSTNLFNTLILSPENCEFLKKTTTEQMTQALRNVDHEVQFVDCSFPAALSNAPDLQLVSTENASKSQWNMKWSPNWSVKV
jgi:hypothetical protein